MNNSTTLLFDNIQDIISNPSYTNTIKSHDKFELLNNLCYSLNAKILEKRHKYNTTNLNFRTSTTTYKNNKYNRYTDTSSSEQHTTTQYEDTVNVPSVTKYNKKPNNNYNKQSPTSYDKTSTYEKHGTYNYNNSETVLLSLNKSLNILSPTNIDVVFGNILEANGMYIVNTITEYMDNYNKFLLKFKSDDNMIQALDFKNLQDNIKNFTDYIILIIFKKSLIDFNNFNIYFKFINLIQKINIDKFKYNVNSRVYQYVNKIITTNNSFIKDDNKDFIDSLNNKNKSKTEYLLKELDTLEYMNTLTDNFVTNLKIESLAYLKNTDDTDNIQFGNVNNVNNDTIIIDKLRHYLETTICYKQKAKTVNLTLAPFVNDVLYQLIGYFNKYYNNFTKSSSNKLFTDYLLAIYENFKRINELLIWEPINTIELENRIYFTIGFLHNNKQFIKILDYDLYQDIESELETIKKSNNIPTSVKYKLLDTIDNFIQNRLS